MIFLRLRHSLLEVQNFRLGKILAPYYTSHRFSLRTLSIIFRDNLQFDGITFSFQFVLENSLSQRDYNDYFYVYIYNSLGNTGILIREVFHSYTIHY